MTQNFFGRSPLKRISYSRYSPDVSPSDVYLFGRIKNALSGREILDEIGLLEAVTEILNGASDTELQRIFRGWIEGVERVIGAGGDYFTS
jgi:hypothetical protein